MFTNCSFDSTKNKFDCCRGKDCVERFCKNLKEHVTKIINYGKKRNDTIKKISLLKRRKFVTFAKKNLGLMKMIKMYLNYIIKSKIIAITQENLDELLTVFLI